MATDPKTIPPAVFQKRAGGNNRYISQHLLYSNNKILAYTQEKIGHFLVTCAIYFFT